MDTNIKTTFMAEGLMNLLIENFGRLNRWLPIYYALVELILWKPKFKVAEIRKYLKVSTGVIPSNVTLQKQLSELVDRNIIIRDRPNYRSIYTYDLSPLAINMLKGTARYFKYFTNARDKRNAVRFMTIQDPLLSISPELGHMPPMSGYHEWESLMEPGIETEQFLQAYRTLTSQWNIYLGDRSADPESRVPYVRANLPRYPFQIDQPPESFGRIGSRPYTFIGKTHLPDLHPAHDPGLKRGRQFMLDFSSFEPRILAYFIKQPELFEMANSADDMYHEIYKTCLSGYPISDIKLLILSWINGAGVKTVSKYITLSESGERQLDLASEVLNKLHLQFPEVEAMSIQLADDWINNGELGTPDGTAQPLCYSKKNKKGIRTLADGERRRKSLALILQTYSGLLGQIIITEAQNLKLAHLRLCVYDGFMFYCKKEHYEAAVFEVSQLLNNITHKLFPTIVMPFKLEWVNDDHGIIFSKELGDSQPQIIHEMFLKNKSADVIIPQASKNIDYKVLMSS